MLDIVENNKWNDWNRWNGIFLIMRCPKIFFGVTRSVTNTRYGVQNDRFERSEKDEAQ